MSGEANVEATNNDSSIGGGGGSSFSLLDKLQLQNATSSVTDTLTTDPREWTQQQIIGVGVGAVVAAIVILLVCYCCRRRKKDAAPKSTGPNKKQSIMNRPYVVRGQGASVSASKLPEGALLHGAEKLRAAKLDGSGVRVSVIDSGIEKDHPAFEGVVRKQKWYLSGTPLSEDDHGTHVAGTIHFLAPKAEIYDYRVFGETGNMNPSEAIVEAIRESVKDGCHIINMSLTLGNQNLPAIERAVKDAAKKGVVMVCAAGNSGDGDPTTNEMFSFPARWKETISVAAVKKVNGLPVAKFSESNPQVDFAGIGVDVTSLKPGGGFQKMSGTSMVSYLDLSCIMAL
jgi:major intracellular serine protease